MPLSACLFTLLTSTALAPPAQRRFRVEQTYRVQAPPAGSREAELFLPIPEDDAWQTVTDLSIEGAPFELVHDPTYGDTAARVALPKAGATLKISYEVLRRERSVDLSRATLRPAPDGYRRYLHDDRLVPVDDRVRAIARDIVRGQATPLDKARAIYAYTLAHMKYQKKGDGWGNGSIAWACDKKYGNCTDFHSLLIGLLRASGIPARFQIGYAVPPEAAGVLPGYHCWADFYLDGVGWVPVDASEAWQAPGRRDYLFGHHDPNRFALSTGRDIAFPGMRGSPLNYFVYPYLEVDSRPAPELLSRETRFESLE